MKRGPYAKGVAKRAEILDAALEVIGRKGFSGATVKELAEAVGLSQNGLLHYFGSRDELFAQVLRRRDERFEVQFAEDANPEDVIEFVVEGIRHNAEVPGLVQLYAQLSTEAAREDHPLHQYFRERYRAVGAALTEVFRHLQSEGRLSDDVQPETLSTSVIALMDGLQTLWMYDDDLDMAAHVESMLRAVGVRAAVIAEDVR